MSANNEDNEAAMADKVKKVAKNMEDKFPAIAPAVHDAVVSVCEKTDAFLGALETPCQGIRKARSERQNSR